MRNCDVMVTVEGGVAQVNVLTSGVLVEVRDFDVEGADEDAAFLWINEAGDRCWRFFVGDEADEQSLSATTKQEDAP